MVREWSPTAAMLDARDSGAAVAIDLQVGLQPLLFTTRLVIEKANGDAQPSPKTTPVPPDDTWS